jgi:uncharacterized membrane-anchored protein
MQAKYRNNAKTLLLSVLFLIIPAIIFGLWIYVFENYFNEPQSEKVKIYNSYFPAFMRNSFSIAIVVLISSLLAIVFASISLKKSSAVIKVIGVIIIIVASLFLLLQGFSMM